MNNTSELTLAHSQSTLNMGVSQTILTKARAKRGRVSPRLGH